MIVGGLTLMAFGMFVVCLIARRLFRTNSSKPIKNKF